MADDRYQAVVGEATNQFEKATNQFLSTSEGYGSVF